MNRQRTISMDLLYLNTLKTNSTGAKVLAKKSNTYDELQVRRKEKNEPKSLYGGADIATKDENFF